ncbi:MAG: hypothetical protein JWM80_303 [Cyanobacteria bacterium RYN_339]|nr:hypothetical protein [Cyanobacteria bacterium RYN_339]
MVMPSPRRFLPGSDAEWTGLFLFGVGLYGSLQHAVMRHLTMFGWIPADWFYLGLLGVGGSLLIGSAPMPTAEDGPTPWQARAAYAFRVVAALGLLAYMGFRVVIAR